ncbi:outer membrane protein assembly factor BamD [Sheuella amnicola]|uniref:outer membrane protein assembly factor BamD n=1 Tax=Sheuella amnicola TaxID=2707330 RepID=UPI000E976F13|nr:outer membrane protein assembly factor BamD [Alcaligenaceae bacterium]
MGRPAFFLFQNLPGFASIGRILVLIAAIILAGCGTKGQEFDPTAGWNAERLYQDGKEEMNAGNWKVCKERFIAVETRFPLGVYAQQAMISLAYCYWKDKEPEQALATLARFQQQYPNHPSMDYVLYLKGTINFTPPSAMFSNITGQNPGERDPKALRQSYAAYNELIDRFPESRYTVDAKKRVAWLVNTMADNEKFVARYYYDRYAYVAAINRAQVVITEFQGVPAAEEALYIMMMSYEKLGMTDLRNDTERVLLANFPKTKLIKEGFPDKYSSWNVLRLF